MVVVAVVFVVVVAVVVDRGGGCGVGSAGDVTYLVVPYSCWLVDRFVLAACC